MPTREHDEITATLLACFVLATIPISPAIAEESIECPSQVGVLKGTKVTNLGGMAYVYTETLELGREYGRKDMEGRWKIKRFDQDVIYPTNIPLSLSIPEKTLDFGGGHSLKCRSQVVGNRVESRCTEGTAYLDVQGGRIGSKTSGLWTGTVAANGFAKYQFNEHSPMLTGWLKEPEKKDLSIDITLEHDDQGRYVYTAIGPGKLLIGAKAKVEPEKYTDRVIWTLPDIDGSTRVLQPANATGAEVMATYTTMPEDNVDFGKHTIRATLQVDDCVIEAETEIRVFYERDAHNNIKRPQPNWFYYWGQTACARPYGEHINILWEPSYTDCGTGSTLGAFPYQTHWLPHKGFYMCDLLAVLGNKFEHDIPLLRRTGTAPNIGFVYDGDQTSYGIDTYGVTVMHEYHHYLNYQRWWQAYGIPWASLWATYDKDQDGILDSKEADLGFDPNRIMSFGGDRLKAHLQYDEHWLAYEKTRDFTLGSCKDEDWAHPGSNWP